VDLDVVFLGTAGSVPTARRAPSATLLRRGGDRILLDCAEGTQRQLLRSTLGLVDVDMVLFSHYHGDHVLGLPGLLKTYGLRGRERGLELYGPPGLRDLLRVFAPLVGRLPFPLHARELAAGDAIPGDGYELVAHAAEHRVPAVAWALVEASRPGRFDVAAARARGVPEGPLFGRLQRGEDVTLPDGSLVAAGEVVGPSRRGRRLVFSGDTRPCADVREAATGADLLVHEASFVSEDAERAAETWHSTAAAAAELARDCDVALLALTHLGARAAPRQVKDEARARFPRTVVPRDLDIIVLPVPERGAPQHVRGGAQPSDAAAAGDRVERPAATDAGNASEEGSR
jgi:ribonuclease Z